MPTVTTQQRDIAKLLERGAEIFGDMNEEEKNRACVFTQDLLTRIDTLELKIFRRRVETWGWAILAVACLIGWIVK